jgi:protein-L-isoaspartate(D-aspartate) O-methyltransferase
MPRRPDRRTPGAAIVRQVRAHGISDARVLDALSQIPRERFLPPDARTHAQADRAVPIGFEQTISQPFIVALMTLELALTGVERVLEIGTGSGYQAAVLSLLASEVYTVERHATLSLRARGILDGLGLANLHYHIGDGSLGWVEEAPYDRILVTAFAPVLPPALFSQLVEGGVLVAPLGTDEEQHITVVRKQAGRAVARRLIPCRFVKLIGQEGWDEEDSA